VKAESRQRIRIASIVGDRLLSSTWLKRLARISFLGTLDEHPRSRHASTRWEHSLAVAERGVAVARELELDPERTKVFVAACVLHDVGHYPLSHAAEPAFTRVFGESHHGIGRWIVCGSDRVPVDASLRPLLEDEGIDPDRVWAVIEGAADDPVLAELSALLAAPINLDTLDGIPRVVRDFRLRRRRAWPEKMFTWAGEELALTADAVEAMDEFWQLKDHVYTEVINVPSNILAEARLCDLVAAHVGAEEIAGLPELDDAWLRERLGRALKAARLDLADDEEWHLANHGEAAGSLVRMRKRYYVDPRASAHDGALPRSRWRERYRHERVPGYLVSRSQQLQLPGFATLESPEI
jgi:hypothetical protein